MVKIEAYLLLVITVLTFSFGIFTTNSNKTDNKIGKITKLSIITYYKSLINYIGPYNENTSIKVALFDTGINLTKYKNNLLINPGEIPNDHLDND